MTTNKPTYRPAIPVNSLAALSAFSSKERDAETGLSYFGARYYSSDLSIWLSVDPKVDKYPSLSPYVYCANNPVKMVDPNGEEIGDFFDLKGRYLGTDGIDDGKIYITTQEDWTNCSYLENGMTLITIPQLGFSRKPSQVNLSNEAIKNVVGHYNSTGLKLYKGSSTALQTEFIGNEQSYLTKLTINIDQWKDNVFLDNYYDIISTFDNEKGHIKQCEEMGIKAFSKLTEYRQERYAVDYQKSQPAFSKASDRYKKYVDVYLQSKTDD